MKPKVLLVDDEPLNLATFEAFLANGGYEIHSLTAPGEVLATARALRPDVILLDVMMPELDGYTVCRQLRSDPLVGVVPIVIVTALHDTAARLEGLRAGADDFLTKPCSRDEIRARIRTIVSLNRFRTIAEAETRLREAVEATNRQLDDMVRVRTAELEQANALLLSYASFVSHDLRSPLSVIKGYLSMIAEGAVPVERSRPMIDGAYKGVLMMEELIENILQLARDEHEGSGQRADRSIDPTRVIQRVWAHVSEAFPHSARQFKIAGLPAVPAGALLIERVFYNLLSNAAKYSASRAAPLVEVGVVDTPAGPAIFVRDNGVGFDRRDAEKLFREFSRLPTAGFTEGTGLGLSLVSRLLQAPGGRLWAESEPGAGATFYVHFGPPISCTAEVA